jgi:hypothetical protein
MTGGTEQFDYPESDPRRHAAYIKQKLSELAQHAREDVGKVSDPKAQALFETTAEALDGSQKPMSITSRRVSPLGK